MPPGTIKVWKLCVLRLLGDHGVGLEGASEDSGVCALLALLKAMIWEVLKEMSLMTR